MNVKWVLLICILQMYLNPVTTQQYRNYNEAPQQYEEENDYGYFDESSNDQIKRPVNPRRFMGPGECYCTCEACFAGNVEPCCDEFCRYCPAPGMPNMPMGYPGPYGAAPVGEQKVVFVPFPYPLIVPEEPTLPSTTTTETTTKITTLTTSTTKPDTTTTIQSGFRLRANDLEKEMVARRRKLMQLNPAMKRHRPAWVPKYGIVTIPDYLAAKLMTQITDVRDLKSKTSGRSDHHH